MWIKMPKGKQASVISGLSYRQIMMEKEPNDKIFAALQNVRILPEDHDVVDLGWITCVCEIS